MGEESMRAASDGTPAPVDPGAGKVVSCPVWSGKTGARARKRVAALLAGLALFGLAGCAETQLATHLVGVSQDGPPTGHYKVGRPYQVNGVWYYPEENYRYDETGIASWYGPGFHKRLTANGELFDQDALTAAHPTLQLPSIVRVTNLENGRSIVLRVNDRGPFANGRLIDISRRGAELLGFRDKGTARVRVQVLEDESRQVAALARQGRVAPPPVDPGAPVLAAAPSASVTRVALTEPQPVRPAPTPVTPQVVRTPEGDIAPRAVVQQTSVTPTSIFVQAGAFSVYENAARLRAALTPIGPAEISRTTVDGTDFYRVRLGPLASVEEADRILGSVIRQGQTAARIIVD